MKPFRATLALLMVTGCAKIKVEPVPATPTGAPQQMDGFFYALPRTVVKVTLPVERTARTAAPFRVYLPLFFPRKFEAEEFVAKSEVKFAVKKPAFATAGEPDPGKVFFVKITGAAPVDRTAFVEHNEQGSVTGVEAQADNLTTDILLGTLSAATGIATRTAFGQGRELEADCKSPQGDDIVRCKIKSSLLDDEVKQVLMERFDLLPAEKRKPLTEAATIGNPSLDQALKAFKSIADLEGARLEYLKGGKQATLEVHLRELEKSIDTEISYYFTGSESKETWTGNFEVRAASVGDTPDLLRIDSAAGICVLGDLRGQDAPKSKFVQKDCTAAAGDLAELRFTIDPADQIFTRVSANFTQTGDRSFRYAIPAMTKIQLYTGAKVTGETWQQMAQFGGLASLPASSGVRSLNYSLKFFEATGALKSFKLASKSAIQRSIIDAGSTSANALIDAKAKSEDELAKLEREAKILDAKKKIQGLCKDLNLACGGFTPAPPQ